ncbi:MAG: tripartite tricarboxylate transporter TctB family protein [Gemmatimonadota bacterium]
MTAQTDRILGAFLAIVGGTIGVVATGYRVGFMTDPVGPRALPYLTAVILVGAGLWLVVHPRPASDPVGDGPRRSSVRALAACGCFVAYSLVLPWIGFFAATALVVCAVGLLFRGPPRGTVAAGLLTSGALWLLFVRVLQLPLPIGSLWIL